MTRGQFFHDLREGLDEIRVQAEIFLSLSAEQINFQTPAHEWTIGRQFEHLHLSQAGIIDQMDERLTKLSSAQAPEIKHSFLGRFIIKGAGPTGNAPVPKPFLPGSRQYDVSTVALYLSEIERIQKMLPLLENAAIEKEKVFSPVSRLIRYSFMDALAIIVEHGRRHLNQCESIKRHSLFPSLD